MFLLTLQKQDDVASLSGIINELLNAPTDEDVRTDKMT